MGHVKLVLKCNNYKLNTTVSYKGKYAEIQQRFDLFNGQTAVLNGVINSAVEIGLDLISKRDPYLLPKLLSGEKKLSIKVIFSRLEKLSVIRTESFSTVIAEKDLITPLTKIIVNN